MKQNNAKMREKSIKPDAKNNSGDAAYSLCGAILAALPG
jgi:hypothetical protein